MTKQVSPELMQFDFGSDTQAMADETAKSAQILLHPLFTGQVLLQTLPINELYLSVKRAVLLRETGCVFTGESGIGKSAAVNMVQAMLTMQFPRMCIFKHDAHNHQIPSIRAFFKHFLSTVGHKEQRGETYDLRARLVNILVDEARMSGTNLVVMFIDEAQAMLLSDFQFLKDVYNDLDGEKVQLVTMLMGQSPETEAVIHKLRLANKNDLIGRFATHISPIRSYNSVTDLTTIFAAIDRLQYPAGSAVSWTGFFLPKACASGFRLENEAGNLLSAIREESQEPTRKVVQFPARATFLAIRAFLLSASSFDAGQLRVPDTLWRRSVAYAKVQDAIERMQIEKKLKKKKGLL